MICCSRFSCGLSNGRYQLISGERRLRAAIKAGWSTIPARVRQADDRLVAELAIVENLQRKDLNAIEKALSFRRYLDEHGCTQEYLANRLKIDRSTLTNLIRLLELPTQVQEALRSGEITMGHARALLPLGDEAAQIEFCKRIQKEGMNVRTTEQEVAERIAARMDPVQPVTSRAEAGSKCPAGFAATGVKTRLGNECRYSPNCAGSGRIVVHFSNNREFERLQGSFRLVSRP